jgi:hypothetical protein
MRIAPGFHASSLVLLLGLEGSLAAQTTKQTPEAPVQTPTPTTGPANTLRIVAVEPPKAPLNSEILVRIDELPAQVAQDSFDPSKYILFINSQKFPSITGHLTADRSSLAFRIQRGGATDELEAWNRLLAGTFAAERPVTLTIGTSERSQLGTVSGLTQPIFTLQIFSPRALTTAGLGFALSLVAFWLLAIKSDVIRDTGPPAPPIGKRRPYSLSKFQMAVWFFVVLASFIFIYIITGDTNSISEQALALIGIGSGTALGAAAIDANKRGTNDSGLSTLALQQAPVVAELAEAKTELAALQNSTNPSDQERARVLRVTIADKTAQQVAFQKQIDALNVQIANPTSEGFVTDILTDAKGISFHRFQMLAWTAVLVSIFLNGVFRTLTMPPLNPTLLALMGISAGTYLGFKFPEKQT